MRNGKGLPRFPETEGAKRRTASFYFGFRECENGVGLPRIPEFGNAKRRKASRSPGVPLGYPRVTSELPLGYPWG